MENFAIDLSTFTIQHPMKKLVDFLISSWKVTQRRSGRERSMGVTKQKQPYMCYHRPVHTFLLFDIYIRIHIYIYIYAISVSVYLYLSMLSAHAIPRSEELARKKRVSPTKRVSMNSSESPRKLVGDITMSALALEQIFQKIAELLD